MKNTFKKIGVYIRQHPKIDLIILGIGLTIFLVVALLNAPRAAIWFDEAFSAYIIQFSYWDIARYTAVDVHPPVYYWILKAWSSLFGTTELALRSLSVVFGAGIIGVSFFLTRKLFGRASAWLTVLLLSVSPMLIRYSDEARMYSLAALIVMVATYVLIKAKANNSRKNWIIYALLVSLGMWTHYFTALAWVAHWVWWVAQKWTKNQSLKKNLKAVFSKEWFLAYVLAVVLFIPWLIVMIRQLGVVQSGGFWIGPVGVNTVNNYFTNIFYYLEHGQVRSWLALLLLSVLAILVVNIPKAYRTLKNKQKPGFWLIALLAWVPPVLLFVASMPPLRSSFVERYLVPAVVAATIFGAVVIVYGTQKWKFVWRVALVITIVAMMITGITNVYKYGNYNKNTNTNIQTRDAVQAAQAAAGPGVPIIASSPWLFYEAAPYATSEHPIYFIDEDTDYIFGSLEMLNDNDRNKIKDLNAFERQHPIIWYLGMGDADSVTGYRSDWEPLRTVGPTDQYTGKTIYKATEFRVNQ